MRFVTTRHLLLFMLAVGCTSEPAGGTTMRRGDAQADAASRDASARNDAGEARDASGTDGASGDAATIVCASSGECPQTYYCDLGEDCAAPGLCKLIPECGDTGTQACGCDEQTYESACLANVARVSVAYAGRCQDPISCDPMEAVGDGSDVCPLGFKWTGSDCIQVRGCNGCTGADCEKLFTFEGCEAHKAMCAS